MREPLNVSLILNEKCDKKDIFKNVPYYHHRIHLTLNIHNVTSTYHSSNPIFPNQQYKQPNSLLCLNWNVTYHLGIIGLGLPLIANLFLIFCDDLELLAPNPRGTSKSLKTKTNKCQCNTRIENKSQNERANESEINTPLVKLIGGSGPPSSARECLPEKAAR